MFRSNLIVPCLQRKAGSARLDSGLTSTRVSTASGTRKNAEHFGMFSAGTAEQASLTGFKASISQKYAEVLRLFFVRLAVLTLVEVGVLFTCGSGIPLQTGHSQFAPEHAEEVRC